MHLITERHHRLPAEFYRDCCAVSFTACLQARDHALAHPTVFQAMEEFIVDAAALYASDALLYLFMPDHAHIVLTGSADGDVLAAMKRFKQRSGFWLARNAPDVRWQKDFHDHIIRSPQDLDQHIVYILNNPVRAGLVTSWRDYPYRGSTLINLNTWEETLYPPRQT